MKFLLWLVVAVQIIAESLPISSSSHMRLFEIFFLSPGSLAALPACFDQLLHGPTIVVLMIFFFKAWLIPARFLIVRLIRGVKAKSFSGSTLRLLSIFFKLLALVAVTSLLPVVMMYGIIKPFLAHTSWFAHPGAMVAGLFVTSASLLSLRFLRGGQGHEQGTGRICVRVAVTLGLVQALSLLPGISRFASTYVASRFLGFSVRRAFQLCFLIEFPLIVAGFGINGIGGLLRTPGWSSIFSWEVVVATVVSSVLAYYALWLAWWMASTHRLWWFGVYVAGAAAILSQVCPA